MLLREVQQGAGYFESFNNSLISLKASHIIRLLQAQGSSSEELKRALFLTALPSYDEHLLLERPKPRLILCPTAWEVAISELKEKSGQMVLSETVTL